MTERILVADDDPVSLLWLAAIVRKAGYACLQAKDGDEALTIALRERPDLILLDVMMPGRDGYEVCAAIRSDPGLADVPVLFVSSRAEPADKVRGLELGAVDYIAKPYDAGEVVARIRTQLRLRLLTHSLANANEELSRKQARLEEDLTAAAHIQRALLPSSRLKLPSLATTWQFVPAQAIGGDMFNAVGLDDSHIAIYIFDVSGHGVPSAMVSVCVTQSLSVAAGIVVTGTGDHPRVSSPATVLQALGREYPFERFGKYFTISYLVLDVRTGLLRYSSAAHPSPLLLHVDGTIRPLEEGGPILGLDVHDRFDEGVLELQPGDRLLLYTDGIVEHTNPRGEPFGQTRIEELLCRTRSQSLARLGNEFLDAVLGFGAGVPPADDVSLLALEFEGHLPARAPTSSQPSAPPWRELSLGVDSRLENVRLLAGAVERFCREVGMSSGDAAAVELALVEAGTNVVKHGYAGERSRPLHLRLAAYEDRVELRLEDQGRPIPVELRRPAEPPPIRDVASLPERGFGLFLIRAYMDLVQYEETPAGNVLVMTKSLREPGAGRP